MMTEDIEPPLMNVSTIQHAPVFARATSHYPWTAQHAERYVRHPVH